MIKSITWRRTFYSSGGLAPSCHLVFLFNIASSPFLSRWPIRIGASGPRLQRILLFSIASMRAAARPVGGRPLAKGSTTATGKSTVALPARSGKASG